LHAARICQDHARVALESDHLPIRDRIARHDGIAVAADAVCICKRARARMHGKHDRQRQFSQRADNAPKGVYIVGIRRAMDGGQRECRALDLQPVEYRSAFGRVRRCAQSQVHHEVADLLHVFADAFSRELRDRTPVRGKMNGRDVIHDHTIDLFWHGTVEGAQPRLDVRYRQS